MRSKRGTLLLQALLIAVAAMILGWVVETWHLLPMTRLTPRWGFPAAPAIFTAIGLVIAFVTVADSWNHAITFEDEHLHIKDALGTIRLRYGEMAEVKVLPRHGVGIKLAPGCDWLAGVEAKPAARAKLKRLSGIGQRFYGCEVILASNLLDVGGDRFSTELRSRLEAARRVDSA